MKQLTLTKDFLNNYGFGLTVDENGLFTNHDIMFNIDYLNFCKVDASVNNGHGLHSIEDNRIKDYFDRHIRKDGANLKPVDWTKFVPVEYTSKRTGKTNKINYLNTSESFVLESHGFDGVTVRHLRYGISEYYFTKFIPKMLKLNPNMQLMENQPEEKHGWDDMKLYYFVDNGKIVGLLAPASQEIEV